VTPEQIDEAIAALELAIANTAMVDSILAHGPWQACRDVKLGLTIEQSKPVLEAVLAALRGLKAS